MILLSVNLLIKNKPFVNSHVDGNKALKKKGIHCVQTRDAEMRRENPHKIQERSNNKISKS